jgi:hypothetical protein
LRRSGGGSPVYLAERQEKSNALSPENLIDKIKLEIRCGIRNIYLMGGTWFMEKRYWDLLKDSLPELNELADKGNNNE